MYIGISYKCVYLYLCIIVTYFCILHFSLVSSICFIFYLTYLCLRMFVLYCRVYLAFLYLVCGWFICNFRVLAASLVMYLVLCIFVFCVFYIPYISKLVSFLSGIWYSCRFVSCILSLYLVLWFLYLGFFLFVSLYLVYL